jgi:dihydroorotate dehydrogenase (fumarate)
MAKRLDQAGANALVLFNRFYQPDIDLDTLEVLPNLNLSSSQDLRLPLRWIAILYGRIKAGMAATGGIHSAADAIKMLMAGADVTMLCSVLMTKGPEAIRQIENAMSNWLSDHDYQSVRQLQGCMCQKNCSDPAAFERAQYLKSLLSYKA